MSDSNASLFRTVAGVPAEQTPRTDPMSRYPEEDEPGWEYSILTATGDRVLWGYRNPASAREMCAEVDEDIPDGAPHRIERRSIGPWTPAVSPE